MSLTYTLSAIPDERFFAGRSQSIESVNRVVGEIANTNIPVHLTGESGTGKDLYGELIHSLSARKLRRFKKFPCGILESGQLLAQLSSILVAGSNGDQSEIGTIYLDGVDELDFGCQKVLLSILSEAEGNRTQTHALPRLISSASKPLEREIELGRFRRELFFRINGVDLRLPPLRERREDIQELLHFFLAGYARHLSKDAPAITEFELELVRSHDWPGNIRELENLARRIVALGDAGKAIGELKSIVSNPISSSVDAEISSLKVVARKASRQAERQLILKALERSHWNRKRAAQELQISYKSLLYKIKQTGIAENRLSEEQP